MVKACEDTGRALLPAEPDSSVRFYDAIHAHRPGTRACQLAKRRAIEQGAVRRRGSLGQLLRHPETGRVLARLLRLGLRATGLLAQGKRNALQPVIRHVELTPPALPEAFCGFRILHLSDLHADGLPGLAERVAARVADLDTDLCVLTGDYRFAVSGPWGRVSQALATIRAAVRAPHGVIGILGNHDSAENVTDLERLGMNVLVNEAMELRRADESLWLLGVDDPHYFRTADLSTALTGVPPSACTILLAHSPELAAAAAAAQVAVYLCGHTHGGQMCLPGLGALWLNAQSARRLGRGAWRYGTMEGFTSAGVGSSLLPVRFNCPPEIDVITLCCPKHAGLRP